MATAARAIDNVIRLDANPQIVAFAYTEGATCAKPGMDGRPRVMFTTTDGRRLFTSDEEASEIEHELQELGIAKGDPIAISRIGRGDSAVIRVERASAPRRPVSAASANASYSTAPAAGIQQSAAPAASTEPAQVSSRFAAAYTSAIDTLLFAKNYAQGRGLALEIRCKDVRALAATIMIDAQKGGR